MKKIKLYAIVGKAGSGKTYVLKKLLRNVNANCIISCTSRPPREDEEDGKNYYFVNRDYFEKNPDKFIEYSEFNHWYYGTRYEDLSTDKINIGVFNPQGIRDLCKSNIDELHVIYLCASDKVRLIRQLKREDNPNIKEIIRRYYTDEDDFKYMYSELNQLLPPDKVLFLNADFDGPDIVYDIVNYIKKVENN